MTAIGDALKWAVVCALLAYCVYVATGGPLMDGFFIAAIVLSAALSGLRVVAPRFRVARSAVLAATAGSISGALWGWPAFELGALIAAAAAAEAW